MVNLICDGPGPHIPASGIVGTGSVAVSGMRCSAVPCRPATDPVDDNRLTLLAKASAALAANATYQAIGSPTTAQAVAQVAALTKQVNALIKLATQALSDTSGT